jgi:hypothetical protein
MRKLIAKPMGSRPLLTGSPVLGRHGGLLRFDEEIFVDPSVAPGLPRAIGSTALLLSATQVVIGYYTKTGLGDTQWTSSASDDAAEYSLAPSDVDQSPEVTAHVIAGYRQFRLRNGRHVFSSPIGPFPYAVYGLIGAGNVLDPLGRTVGWPDNVRITFDPGAWVDGQYADMVDQSHNPFWSMRLASPTNTSLTANITSGAKVIYIDSLIATTPAVSAGGSIIICKLADPQGRSQIYDVVGTPTPATFVGTVDLNTLAYPGDFGVKNITFTHGGVAHLLTFANPANPAAVISQLNAAIVATFGSAVALAVLNAGKFLQITGTTGSVKLTSGTLAAATVGWASGVASGVAVATERVVKFNWIATDTFVSTCVRRPSNITIDGRGGRITGNLSRTSEIVGGKNCTVENLQLEPVLIGDGYTSGCDVPSFRYTWRNCIVKCVTNTGAVYGMGVEAGEEASFERCCVIAPFTNAAFQVYDGITCRLDKCQGESISGVLIKRSQDTKVIDCEFSACSAAGVLDDSDCTSLEVRGTTALACNRGFNFLGSLAKAIDCRAINSIAVGFYISGIKALLEQCESNGAFAGFWTDAADTVYSRCLAINSVGYDFGGSVGWKLLDCETFGSSLASISGASLADGEIVVVRGGTYRSGTVPPSVWPFAHRVAWLNTAARPNCRWYFFGVTFILNSASAYGVIWENALKSVTFENCRWISNAGGQTAIHAGAASSVWLLGDNDFGACATTILTPGGAAKLSRGTLTLNGAAAVTYAFPDITANNTVRVRLVAVAGTQGLTPTFVISPGVGVVATGSALDLSTWALEIS